MRADPIEFAAANESASREPRCVIRIEFDTASPHLTSHDDITGVPGDVMYSVVQKPSAISQRIVPDEGRSEIGSLSFTLVDKDSVFTEAMRAQLTDQSAGLRRRKVEFYIGYRGMDFADFQLFQTQIVTRCTYRAGQYQVTCSDITRQLRTEIFRPVSTTLRDSITDVATTVPVYDTTKFHMVAHGPAYSDAPNATVGYLRIQEEVIRYTGQTLDSYTGCTRGVMNTKAVAHAVDAGTTAERRTKVEEYIYLEGPGPQLALAIQTGDLYGTANTLPEHWTTGIDPSFIRESDFTSIGLDLWDPSNDAGALTLRFDGLKQQDGKKFLEKEIYLLIGCFSSVYSDGALGLRRMTAVISDASPVVTLTEREIIELSPLEHEYTLLHNDFFIEWAWNSITEDYERVTDFFDITSMEAHGESPLLKYSFKGLHSSRATDSTVAVRLDSIRDRYSQPPQTVSATVFGSLNRVEVGDIAGIRVPETILRDFTIPAGDYNRSHEVQQMTYDWYSGRIELELFGSTARPVDLPTTDTSDSALPDAWYTSAGTSLGSVITITGNIAATGSHTLTGATTLTASGAIFYWDDDLTIPSGCNITLAANVQLRVRGFVTLIGTINGVGGGKAGVSDPGTGLWDVTFSGNAGFVGHSRGWDGIKSIQRMSRTPHQLCRTIPAVFTRAQYEAFPLLTLQVVGGDLIGLPNDLRGTGGAPGGRVVGFPSDPNDPPPIIDEGKPGGDGGAGLAIICRGMSFGVSASINLSGESTVSNSLVTFSDVDMYAGAGGPGGPGALLILLDGNNISVPVVTGKVICTTGGITQSGNPMKAPETVLASVKFLASTDPGPPHSGYPAAGLLGAWSADSTVPNAVMAPLDMSNAAHRIQYIPIPQDATVDEDNRPPPPTQLRAGPGNGGNICVWFNPDLSTFDVVEIWASLDNNRTNALKVGETRSTDFTHRLPLGGLYYYWIRTKLNPISGRPAVYSEWERELASDGESSNSETPGETPEAPDDFTATPKVNGIQFQWSLPWAKLSGLIRLYEGASGSDFDDATMVWEGYAFGYFLSQTDTTTRDYWIVLGKGGSESIPEPNGAGLPAAASSATSALTATAYPNSVVRSATIGPNPRTVITPPTTLTASGGTPPYTYAWTWDAGGAGITTDSPTFDDTTFSGSHNLDGTIYWGTARCTVTDAVSATAFDTVEVQLAWPSIA